MPPDAPTAGLVLPGGGARGAYQVGALKAIAEIIDTRINPFPVIMGASVGAINAVALASQTRHFKRAVQQLDLVAAEAELREAEARLKQAKENLERSQELFDSQVLSQGQLDEARYEFDAWSGRSDQLTADIARTGPGTR